MRGTGRWVLGTTGLAAVAIGLSACAIQVPVGGGAPAVTAPVPGATQDGAVTVPLQVVHQQGATLVLVPVKISGKGPYPFVLDTGASTSGVNEVLAEQLDLPKTGESSQVSGVTGSDSVEEVRIESWSIAGTALKPTSVGALPFAGGGSGGTSSSGIAGLLGSDQLSRFGSITIDYQHERLHFTPGIG